MNSAFAPTFEFLTFGSFGRHPPATSAGTFVSRASRFSGVGVTDIVVSGGFGSLDC